MIQDTPLITLKRLRTYAILIAVSIWTILALDFSSAGPIDRLGKVKGTDFLHFYVTGSVVRDGRWDQLYDARAQYERARAVAPGSSETFFIPVESPQTALLFAPLAALFGIAAALAIWLIVTFLAFAGSCAMLWRECPALPRTRRRGGELCGLPGFVQRRPARTALVPGARLHRRRPRRAPAREPFEAGLAIGLLVFKPHWFVAAALVFLAMREWRVLAGAGVAAAAQLGATLVVAGSHVMAAYANALRSLPRIADLLEPQAGGSLRSIISMILPSEPAAFVLYAAAVLATLIVVSSVWRSSAPSEIRCSTLLLAVVLISPHVGIYDLVVLAPIYFLMANWTARTVDGPQRQALIGLLCVSFVAPFAAGLPTIVRSLMTVGTEAALLWTLWRMAVAPRLWPREDLAIRSVASAVGDAG